MAELFEMPWYFSLMFGNKLSGGLATLAKYLAVGSALYTGAKLLPKVISPDRERLIRAFQAAEICVKRKRTGTNGKPYDSSIYPKIERVSRSNGRLTISFRLPVGLNPADLERKEYVFKQAFGPLASLHRSDDRFYQLIVSASLPASIPYSYHSIAEAFKRYGGLPVFAGINRDNKPVCYDMRRSPHLGIVGVTGYGKSSFLRVLLCSWLQYFTPDQLQFYLGDLKKTEFQQYRNVAHVQRVAVSRSDVESMLREVVLIMDQRSAYLARAGATSLEQYTKRTGRMLPYVVVCIDEVALLQKEKAAHEYLEEIGAIGRALGVFLVLSQQRIDSEIMDGKLKNNLTVRVAFRMGDALNSRMFLDNDAAANLTIPGRAIVKMPDAMQEVQAPWLSEEEAEKIIERYRIEPKEPDQGKEEEIIFGELII